jgi:NadR type nicotinamide-nucleotide adenylyltransferase
MKEGRRRLNSQILRIAVTGPESTGKSILAEQLALHYQTVWVAEYAREYLEKIARPYDQHDITEIAKGQVEAEVRLQKEARTILLCDTDLTVTKIWSEVKYNHCDPVIIRLMEKNPYDLFLLCDIDLPWVDDPLREHPHLRPYLFGLYKKELQTRGVNFAVVSGSGASRLENAIKIIETSFPQIKPN